MSHNAYTSGRGGLAANWPSNAAVTSAEFAWFATGVFEAINGDQGGTWAPANAIIIGGAGVQFTTVATTFYGITCSGTATFNGTSTFNGTASFNDTVTIGNSISDTLTVYSQTGFYSDIESIGNVKIDGGTNLSHKTLTVGANVEATFGNSLTVGGTATFNAGAQFNSAVNCSGNVGLDGTFTEINGGSSGSHVSFQVGQYVDTTFAGAETHAGSITNSGTVTQTGPFVQTLAVVTADPTAIAAGVRNVIGNIAGDGTITLSATGAEGQFISIVNQSISVLTVKTSGGATLCSLLKNDVPDPWADLVWHSGGWVVFRKSAGA